MKRPSITRQSIGAAALAAALAAAGSTAATAADFKVGLNETRVMVLPQPVGTIVIGNPSVANVYVENDRRLFVLGKSYGETNMIVLDADGHPMNEIDLQVVARDDNHITLMKGTAQISYNCAPRCHRVVDPTDAAEPFGLLVGQNTAAASLGEGSSGEASD